MDIVIFTEFLSFTDVVCQETKLDILYLVDGSGSVKSENFERIKLELKEINAKFDIGADKTQIALMQFGSASQTRIEFNFGAKNSLQTVNEGVQNMEWLESFKTETGNALKQAREKARLVRDFNPLGTDRGQNNPVTFIRKVTVSNIYNIE